MRVVYGHHCQRSGLITGDRRSASDWSNTMYTPGHQSPSESNYNAFTDAAIIQLNLAVYLSVTAFGLILGIPFYVALTTFKIFSKSRQP
jgi:hypothetical protein